MVNKIITTYTLTLVISLLLVSTFSCDSNVQNDNSVLNDKVPDSLKVDTVEKLIFNNSTFVIYTAYNNDKTATYEFWYKNNKQVHVVHYPIFDINYKWLVNVDSDNDLEIIRAQGYEDGVDYGIYEKNRNSEKLLLRFNPALLDQRYPDRVFWGYPKDLERLIVNHTKQLLASFEVPDHRDDNYTMSENQKQLPYIFFYGKTNQPEFELEIDPSKRKYMTLQTIITKSQQPNYAEFEIPADSYVHDSVSFVLENSRYKVLSLEKLSEKNNASGSHFGLPIIVLQNNLLIDKNDDIVLSDNSNCLADGYDGVFVEGKQFTLQQQFCADFLLVRSITTFKIDPNNNEIILSKYMEEYTDRSNPDRSIPAKIWKSKDFGKVLFRETTDSFLKEIRQTKPK